MEIKNTLKNNFYLFLCLCTVLIIYLPSLIRPWLPFDENLFYNETLFPIPLSFTEIPEIIKYFVLGSHVDSTNPFFSNISNIRANPMTFVSVTFLSSLLTKNPIGYHFLQLSLHLLNTALVWSIFLKVSKLSLKTGLSNKMFNLLIFLFVLMWALHGANTEAVLLTINWNAMLTHTICFALTLFGINKILNGSYIYSKIEGFLVTSLFFLTMLLTEYGYTLPIILFFLYLVLIFKKQGSIKSASRIALNLSLPLFIGLGLYIFYSLFTPHSAVSNLFSFSPSLFIERNLWFTPQIFVHLLKLIIFPKTLSIYQSNLTILGEKLIEPYTVSCTIVYLLFLLLPIILFFLTRKKTISYIFILIYSFYFSLFPFLHIITPTYCLSADRYCYFPSFFFYFVLFNLIVNKIASKKVVLILLICVFAMSARTFIRILEWRNTETLFRSTVEIQKNPLYKGHTLVSYANNIGSINEVKAERALNEGIKEFTKAISLYNYLKSKNIVQPATLTQYGLDYDSLLIKSAYGIANAKVENYNEPAESVLSFWEPYIKDHLYLASVNEIALYAGNLIRARKYQDAENVLKLGLKKFPLSSELLYYLADIYLMQKDPATLDKAYEPLRVALKFFPNDKVVLHKLFEYYKLKNDKEHQAQISYLIGLREHSVLGYLNSAQLNLELNHSKSANKSIVKLEKIIGKTSITLFLKSLYFNQIGSYEKVLPLLLKAYELRQTNNKLEAQYLKNILQSLINIYKNLNDNEKVNYYTQELVKYSK